MPLLTRYVLTLGVAAVVTTTAGAQGVETGQWIRISTRNPNADPAWVVGSVTAITDMYVVLEPIGAGPLAIPHNRLTRLEINQGWTSRARFGGVVGGLAGVVLGVGMSLTSWCTDYCALAPIPLATAMGISLGAGMPRIGWHAIPPHRIRPHILAYPPTRHRLGVGFAF